MFLITLMFKISNSNGKENYNPEDSEITCGWTAKYSTDYENKE